MGEESLAKRNPAEHSYRAAIFTTANGLIGAPESLYQVARHAR